MRQKVVDLVATTRAKLDEFVSINASTYWRGDSASFAVQSVGVLYLDITFEGGKGLPSSPVDLCGVSITTNHAFLC
jgi:hypothetical protein